jgi:hypothetical protein
VPRDGATTLSDLITPTLTLVCKPCDRNGVYNVKNLVAKHGDARSTDLRAFLTANCPKRGNYKRTDQCQAVYDPPPETRRERPMW